MNLQKKHCIDQLSISALADPSKDYAYHAVIIEDKTDRIEILWNADRTKVKGHRRLPRERRERTPKSTRSIAHFNFDASQGLFHANNRYVHRLGEDSEIENESFTIRSLDESLELNVITLEGRIETEYGHHWALNMGTNWMMRWFLLSPSPSWSSYQVDLLRLSEACVLRRQSITFIQVT